MNEGAVHFPLLRLREIRKSFPGIRVLDGVSLDVHAGEVHVLFGENGAGKSTLVNIVVGTYAADDGTVLLQGTEVKPASPKAARDSGISVVFQELSLVPTLSVCANIFLGSEAGLAGLLDQRAMENEAESMLRLLGFAVDLRLPVSQLSRAEQQMVEIAKALRTKPKILILDEPTSFEPTE